jgi:hemolysin D
LATAREKAAALAQELREAERRLELMQLRAPVDGHVQELAATTIGGIVTPAQQLMIIVPTDSGLEVEAYVLNKDIGFVRPGQEAQIKVQTFNFTRYGLLAGKVLDVSDDVITRDQDAEGPAEPTYAARIALERTNMEIDGREVNLSPGMAVTAEIRTGERRLIEYLLSPLLRYRHEAMKER